jgi:hypothetical protein
MVQRPLKGFKNIKIHSERIPAPKKEALILIAGTT